MRRPSGISVFRMNVAFVERISRSGCCGCDTRGGMAEERSQAALNWMHRGLSSSSPGSLAVSRARRGVNVA
jgi:hypothetical protein